MSRPILNVTLAGVGLLCLGGCVFAPNSAEHAMTISEQHPITVDSQIVTLTLSSDTALSSLDRSRLTAFAMAYLNDGHGPITITTPTGGGREATASSLAGAARSALAEAGVSENAVSTASYIANQSVDRDVIVSYTRFVATASACGIWSGQRKRDYRNLRTAEFGCATRNNLAAMVGDPRDLVAAGALTDPDPVFRVRGVGAYREGVVTSSQTDSIIEAETDG